MTVVSVILGMLSLLMCFMPVYGLIVALLSVVIIAILKKKREYGINKAKLKNLALIISIAALVISIFVTGVSVTKDAIENQANEAALNDVKNSFNSATLRYIEQQASFAWNEARMRGLKGEKMKQYILDYLSDRGTDTSVVELEITNTGVIVKIK